MTTTIVILAHGTVEHLSELPAFLKEIRHGRPAPESLLKELNDRYERVGGSPLLAHTLAQAQALEEATGIETRVAMRLSAPRISDVLEDKGSEDLIILVPAAPFSVAVYDDAARKELSGNANAPKIECIDPWGQQPQLIGAFADGVVQALLNAPEKKTEVILTAHSLPQIVIDRGDPYAEQFEECARLVASQIQARLKQAGKTAPLVTACYQSQGAIDASWLGPDLDSALVSAQRHGAKRIVLSPIGFLTEHIETLFDLDIEAKARALTLGLDFVRIPAAGCHPGLIAGMAAAVQTRHRG